MAQNFTDKTAKLGFFGGSFDPIHQGHLSVALAALEKFDLRKILLCPAFFAPLRKEKPLFSAEHRLAMVESVAREHTSLSTFDHEIRSSRTCYTYETLKAVQQLYPNEQVFLMLGDDQLNKFDQWKFHRLILEEFPMIVFNREQPSEEKVLNENFTNSRIHYLDNPLFPHSSTEIRNRITQQLDISNLVSNSVHSYMKNNRLLFSNNP